MELGIKIKKNTRTNVLLFMRATNPCKKNKNKKEVALEKNPFKRIHCHILKKSMDSCSATIKRSTSSLVL